MNISTTYEKAHLNNRQYILPISLFQLVRRVLELEDSQKPILNLIEIGCGQGTLFSKFLDHGHNFVGIDISKTAIQRARAYEKRMPFYCLDVRDIELMDQRFDIFVDSHLLHCLGSLKSVQEYLLKLKSVAKPGARIIIETMVISKGLLKSDSMCSDDGYIIKDLLGVGRRIIFDGRFIENLVLKLGFRIDYMNFPVGAKFVLDGKRVESLESDPDVIQLILRVP